MSTANSLRLLFAVGLCWAIAAAGTTAASTTAEPIAATLPAPAEQPALKIGSEVDAHGCKPSAGYTWNNELASCVRPWRSRAITLEVAAERQDCIGLIPMQCLRVREHLPGQEPSAWGLFYSPISGYTHTPGQARLLRVREDEVDKPLADASSRRYSLIQMLD